MYSPTPHPHHHCSTWNISLTLTIPIHPAFAKNHQHSRNTTYVQAGEGAKGGGRRRASAQATKRDSLLACRIITCIAQRVSLRKRALILSPHKSRTALTLQILLDTLQENPLTIPLVLSVTVGVESELGHALRTEGIPTLMTVGSRLQNHLESRSRIRGALRPAAARWRLAGNGDGTSMGFGVGRRRMERLRAMIVSRAEASFASCSGVAVGSCATIARSATSRALYSGEYHMIGCRIMHGVDQGKGLGRGSS